jgi:sortase A
MSNDRPRGRHHAPDPEPDSDEAVGSTAESSAEPTAEPTAEAAEPTSWVAGLDADATAVIPRYPTDPDAVRRSAAFTHRTGGPEYVPQAGGWAFPPPVAGHAGSPVREPETWPVSGAPPEPTATPVRDAAQDDDVDPEAAAAGPLEAAVAPESVVAPERSVPPNDAVHLHDAASPNNAAPPNDAAPPNIPVPPSNAAPPKNAVPPSNAVPPDDAVSPDGPVPRDDAAPHEDATPAARAMPDRPIVRRPVDGSETVLIPAVPAEPVAADPPPDAIRPATRQESRPRHAQPKPEVERPEKGVQVIPLRPIRTEDGYKSVYSQYTRPTIGSMARSFSRGAGELLITVGLIILLFAGYEVWGKAAIVDAHQNDLNRTLAQDWGPDGQPEPSASPTGSPSAAPQPPSGAPIGKLYIPRIK